MREWDQVNTIAPRKKQDVCGPMGPDRTRLAPVVDAVDSEASNEGIFDVVRVCCW
jgi:hypothetical protein